MSSERRKFHPSVMLVHFIKGIRSWLFLLFIILIDTEEIGVYQVVAVSAILIIVVLRSIFKYFTQTYQVTPQKIIVYKGIIKKRETDISYDRIQTIKQRQWFFFKPFNVVELLIETASSTPGKAEASLTAVDISLLDTIEQLQNNLSTDDQENERTLSPIRASFTLSNKQISLYALTDMTVFLIFGAVFSFLGDSIFTGIESVINNLQGILGILVFLIGIIGIIVLSLVKNFVLFYHFKAALEGDTLSVEYGLFERKIQKIPLKKIQAVKVHKQIIRNFFGMSSVELILMGGQEQEGEGLASKKVLLFPLIQTKRVYETMTEFLPNMPIAEPTIQAVTKKELWYFWRWTILIGLPLVVGGWFISSWVSLITFIILIILLAYQWAKSHIQGYTIQENQIICLQQFQGLSTVQLFIAHQNIQSFTRSSSKWLMEKNHGHIQVWFKAGDSPAYFDMRFIRKEDEHFIYETFWKQALIVE
jgi:putative membrane protein